LRQKQKVEQNLQGTSYDTFIDGIVSPQTKVGYKNALIRYMKHLKMTEVDNLLLNQDPRFIESQIIKYIKALKEEGVAYSTMKFLIAPIFTFYQLNNVLLNRRIVSRYLGEFKRVVKDKPYSTEQIQTALTNADPRMRMMILILCSTGCRIGSLTDLNLGNLTKIPEVGLYRITFYEGTNNEYYTFCTRECATTGIDAYLEFRRRCGERLEFDEDTQQWKPEDTPLFRTRFDYSDSLQAKYPQRMNTYSIRTALTTHMTKCGIRHYEHSIAPKPLNRIRKSIPLSNGFRKRVISIFIKAQLSHEIRELIVDHDTHLDQNYYRPSEEQVLHEYMKAEEFLTIDPTLRLANENKILRIEASKVDGVLTELAEIRQQLGLE
jgi:integrase